MVPGRNLGRSKNRPGKSARSLGELPLTGFHPGLKASAPPGTFSAEVPRPENRLRNVQSPETDAQRLSKSSLARSERLD
jgi:hypothetical protein